MAATPDPAGIRQGTLQRPTYIKISSVLESPPSIGSIHECPLRVRRRSSSETKVQASITNGIRSVLFAWIAAQLHALRTEAQFLHGDPSGVQLAAECSGTGRRETTPHSRGPTKYQGSASSQHPIPSPPSSREGWASAFPRPHAALLSDHACSVSLTLPVLFRNLKRWFGSRMCDLSQWRRSRRCGRRQCVRISSLGICKMGLEGIVSKRLSAPYRSGPSRDWIKVKNPDSPAMIRAREAEW
jgi:hypothetical protein